MKKTMAEEFRSRKRKQPSSGSDPLAGIFTRSKSQIYLHRNRSGYARADAALKRNLRRPLEPILNSSEQKQPSEAIVEKGTCNTVVKDLRTKRVFSPTSIEAEVGKINLEGDLKVQKLNDQNPNLPSSTEDDMDVKDLGVSVTSKLNPSSGVTPDPTSVGENPVADANEISEMTSTHNGVASKINEIVGAKVSFTPRHALVPASRSSRKVFKSPSSFSYRRLLPYLMDIAKDDSCPKIEIIGTTLPEKNQKLNSMYSNMVALKDEEIGAESDGRKAPDDSTVNNTETCKEQFSSITDPSLVRAQEGLGGTDLEQRSHEDCLHDSVIECVQMTPPDADIYSKPNMDEGLHVPVKQSEAVVVRNDECCVADLSHENNDPVFVSKLVLNPCSRMKLLKCHTSMTHRRLLPFLMNNRKSTLKVGQHLKLEDMNQSPQQHKRSLLHQSNMLGKSKSTNGTGQPSTEHEKFDSPKTILVPTEVSSNDIKSDSPVSIVAPADSTYDTNGQSRGFNGTTSENMPSDPQMSTESFAEIVKQYCSKKCEKVPDDNDLNSGQEANSSAIPLCSTTLLGTSHRECTVKSSTFDCNSESIRSASLSSEDERKTVTVSMHQDSSQIAAFDPQGIHGDGLTKGILKRNRRGCRGLCNCLNCMSFRLNAEKAFDFSRNQMHDAEEVALELIKELQCLRGVLEKCTTDSTSLATIQEKQVKVACAKALHTEEVAKMHLQQMNEDLSIHCRVTGLQRPKVSFANKVEEKVISMVGWPK